MKIGKIVMSDDKIREYLNFLMHIPNSEFFPSPAIREGWNRNHAIRYALIVESLKKHVSKSSRVIDVGVHPYSLALLLKSELNCEVIGICKSHSLGKGFKEDKRFFVEKKFGILGYLLNVEEDIIPLQKDSFDAVVFAEIIDHLLFSPTHALCEIHRVLKKNGVLIITTPNAIGLIKMIKWILRKNIFDRLSLDDIYGRHNREYTKKELEILLQSCNFEVAEIFTYSLPFDYHKFIFKILYLFPGLREHIFVKACPYGEPVKGYPNEIFRHSLA